jgi:hypothetical protein
MTQRELLTVALDEGAAGLLSAHRTVLASLPNRWRITDGNADVTVIYGGSADWPSRAEAALASGARGMLVTRPDWTDPTTVAALAAAATAADVPITVESAYLADPSWKRALPALRESAAESSLIDSLRIVSTPSAARGERPDILAHCLEQVAVLRTVAGTLTAVAFMQQAPGHYALHGQVGGSVFNAVGIRGGAGANRLTLDLIGLKRTWRVTFDSGAIARPTVVEMVDASGVYTSPANYHTGKRGTWLELHAAITKSAPVSYGLALLGACLRLTAPSLDGIGTETRS